MRLIILSFVVCVIKFQYPYTLFLMRYKFFVFIFVFDAGSAEMKIGNNNFSYSKSVNPQNNDGELCCCQIKNAHPQFSLAKTFSS